MVCAAIRPSIRSAITSAIVEAFCARLIGLPFAQTVASWFDGGAPGRFVPTYRDWQTSGALFQDSLATTPVTALEQFVGFNTDRSRNLRMGNEVVTVPSIAGLPAGGGTRFYGVTMFAMVANRTYEILYTISDYTGTGNVGLAGASPAGVVQINHTANGTFRCRQTPTANGQLAFYTQNTNTANFSGISVKEIPGAHRIQPTATSRPILTARKNWLTNSAWLGGGALPTGWGSAGATGAAAPSGATTDGSVIYRFTAVNERPFLTRNADIVTPASGLQSGSVLVEQVHSGSPTAFQICTWINVPAGGTLSWFKNGLAVASTEPVVAGDRVGCLLTNSTTAGTATFRAGLGASGAITADVSISSPLVTAGTFTMQGRYQRTGLSPQTGDYDAVGFPVGLRYDGIDDCMYTAAELDYSTTDKVTVVYPVRKDSDATRGIVTEQGNNTFNGFILDVPADTSIKARFISAQPGGNPAAFTTDTQYSAPLARVLAGFANWSAAAANAIGLQIGGVVIPSLSIAPTAGNIPKAVNYEGARGNTTARFNGVIYGEMQIGNLRADSEMNYLNAQFAINLSEALA